MSSDQSSRTSWLAATALDGNRRVATTTCPAVAPSWWNVGLGLSWVPPA
ncbi:MAG: hypothetical protein QM779_16985 [Propionicimonas sp.]